MEVDRKDIPHDVKKARLLASMYTDLRIAAKVLFPEQIDSQFDPIHDEMIEVMMDRRYRKRAIAAPRGIGKTTLASLVYATVMALLGGKRYIVLVGATAELAIQNSENLKHEFQNNPQIRKLFPDLRSPEWSKEKWVISAPHGDVCIFPRGAGQAIRGQLWRGYRPDLIIIDDLEKKDEVKSEERRKDKWSWLNADLLRSVNPRSKDWDIVYIGTILHHDSALQKVLDSPSWRSICLEVCDDNFKSNAPSVYTDEELRADYDAAVEDGTVEDWYKEMRNLASMTGKDAAFTAALFQQYDEADEKLWDRKHLENLIIIDPARTANMKSADSAIVTAGIDMLAHRIYLRDAISERFHQDEFYEAVYEAIVAVDAKVVAVEVTGVHEFVTYPLINYLLMKGVVVELIELQARGGVGEPGKATRVRSMVGFYRQGLVYHNKICASVLESQLLQFPNAKKWDVMDAWGYIPEILSKGDRFMMWFNGPDADKEDEHLTDRERVEREFEELMEDYYEDEPLGDWRVFG